MFYLRKTDQLLFDGGEDELENEWSFVSESGDRISVSLNRFIDHPLHSLQEHLSESKDFTELIEALNARKSEGISGNYCTQQGLELFWLKEAFKTHQLLVIVSFGEVNPGRYRLVVEGEFS
ncbi:MAG: hypothetical protein QE487_00565 [Fluviicola sp.]|nr:hypothetical protein [Fluviicola sp.]